MPSARSASSTRSKRSSCARVGARSGSSERAKCVHTASSSSPGERSTRRASAAASCHGAAQPTHAGVDLEMQAQRPRGPRRLRRLQAGPVGERDRHGFVGQTPQGVGSVGGPEQQDVAAHAGGAQSERLLGRGDAEPAHTALCEAACHRDRTVPVAVGLDGGQHARASAEAPPDAAEVVLERLQVDRGDGAVEPIVRGAARRAIVHAVQHTGVVRGGGAGDAVSGSSWSCARATSRDWRRPASARCRAGRRCCTAGTPGTWPPGTRAPAE